MTWLELTRLSLRKDGFAVVPDVVGEPLLRCLRAKMYEVQSAIRTQLGESRIANSGEHGVLRLMLAFDSLFLKLLENEKILAVVDNFLSPTAILHLQNGFILPPAKKQNGADTFQGRWHQDFPRFLNGYHASLNAIVAVDAFTAKNGATRVVAGSHQRAEPPSPTCCRDRSLSLTCPAGAVIFFDSTLWHSAGQNFSRGDRLAINHQFTRSFFKPQMDYVRAIGIKRLCRLPERTQQLLGAYTRVPASLEEYYVPEEKRIYRKHQG